MITVNQEAFDKVVERALTVVTFSVRWTNAIKTATKAVNNLELPFIWWNEKDSSLLISSENSGNIYEIKADGLCQCQAYQNSNPCWHRALHRLMFRYSEAQRQASAIKHDNQPAARKYNEAEKAKIGLEALELFVAG